MYLNAEFSFMQLVSLALSTHITTMWWLPTQLHVREGLVPPEKSVLTVDIAIPVELEVVVHPEGDGFFLDENTVFSFGKAEQQVVESRQNVRLKVGEDSQKYPRSPRGLDID